MPSRDGCARDAPDSGIVPVAGLDLLPSLLPVAAFPAPCGVDPDCFPNLCAIEPNVSEHSPHRAEHLTVFRFCAALIVVIHHYGREATGFGGFAVAGPQMVTFFFAPSGFVMMLAYGAQPVLAVRHYWLARVARILPAYWLAMLLGLGLSLHLHHPPGGAAALLHPLLLQAWWPTEALAINPPAWSLSVEAAFYFAFPLLLPALKKATPARGAALALLFWAVTQAALLALMHAVPDAPKGSWTFNAVLYHPLSHLCSFVLGMAAARVYVCRPLMGGWIEHALLGGLSLLLLLGVGSETRLTTITGIDFAYGASFWSPAFALWILLFARLRNGVAQFFAQRWAVHCGDISYGVYIYQAPLHLLWVTVLHRNTTSPPSFAAFLLALLFLAHCSHAIFERPLQGWIRQRFSGRRA